MPGEKKDAVPASKESKSYILRGLALLLAGSALLLICKFTSLPLAGTLAAYAGGTILLLGNGYIIYGLLIYAGAKDE